MSGDSQDEHEYHNVPFDQHPDDEDDLRIDSQPSFDAFAAQPPPTTAGLVPSEAAQAAAQFVQNPNTYQYPVSSQPAQNYPGQNFLAYYNPTHNEPGQHQFAQSQPGQYQVVQLQPVQSQPGQNFPPYCDPMHSQPGQHQVVQIQPGQSQPEQVNLVQWHRTPSFNASIAHLSNWLRIPDVLDQDLEHIREVGRERIPAPKRACAEQLARSNKFVHWLRNPAPSQLLVHANYRECEEISGMSLFCVSLRRVLASRPDRFIPLVFFCGLHTEQRDDDDDGAESSSDDSSEPRATHSVPPSAARAHGLPSPPLDIGAHGLIRSFIHQLITWYSHHHEPLWFVKTPQEQHAVENNDLRALYELFRSLVRSLPSRMTVCCLVDGVKYYERDEFLEDMESVMRPLLELSASRPTPLIKVLLTSPKDTSDVQDWVADESILSMRELGRPSLVSDEAGLERMLASALR